MRDKRFLPPKVPIKVSFFCSARRATKRLLPKHVEAPPLPQFNFNCWASPNITSSSVSRCAIVSFRTLKSYILLIIGGVLL
jgi:hypothetical protein